MGQDETTKPTTGIVYVLTNPGMPGLVKIGKTINMRARLNTLFSTSVPLPFILHYAAEVENAKELEHSLFEVFSDKRVNNRREFFEVEPERVVAAIRIANGISVREDHKVRDGEDDTTETISVGITDEDIKARDKEAQAQAKAQRRTNFRFEDLGIPIGAELTFSRNRELKATVVDNKSKVEFEGEEMSISGAANIILQRDPQQTITTSVNGALFWEWENEILNAIRTRIEQEREDENEDES